MYSNFSFLEENENLIYKIDDNIILHLEKYSNSVELISFTYNG